MSEQSVVKTARRRRIRHKGRASQILIYLGKQIRFFVNESDWKVLPMSAVIAALVGMVIRKRFFINMEGSLIGGFALACTAIWNGCFNSIQSVCRERPIIKREHRSGMHITSYVTAHMIYQFLLCAAQTGLTMFVLRSMNVQFPKEGFITRWMIVDVGISMFLITYASDMLSLFLSSISHTTTGAMTIMPFVLIFQLVFSGGIIPLPAWSQKLSDYTISSYGIRVLAAQSGYNEKPMITAWNTVAGMRNSEIGGTVTVGQVLDMLNSPALESRRDTVVLRSVTLGEGMDILNGADRTLGLRGRQITVRIVPRKIVEAVQASEAFRGLRDTPVWTAPGGAAVLTVGDLLSGALDTHELDGLLNQEITQTFTVGAVMDLLRVDEYAAANRDAVLNAPVTLGKVIDFLNASPAIQARRDKAFTVKTTVGELLDVFGEEKVKDLVQRKTAAASYKEEYACTDENIIGNWWTLALFALVFALLSTLALELIDRDKR